MAENDYAFRRLTDPFILPVGPTAQRTDVPAGFFQQNGAGFGAMSFCVVNPNNFWIRLRGNKTSTYVEVTETTGWLIPPGFFGIFSTQNPISYSVMSVTRQGFTAGSGNIEICYGGGA